MPTKLPETITEAEMLRIVAAAPKQKHKLAYLLGFYQGLRISEVIGTRVRLSLCCGERIERRKHKDNGNNHSTYHCRKCEKPWHHNQYKESKTEWQIEPLLPGNFDFSQKILRIKNAKGSKDRNLPIMPQIKKKMLDHLPINITDRGLNLAFKEHYKKAGVKKDLHFHCLRHSCATWLLSVKKWDIRYVQNFLGHESITTTQRYTHVSPQDLINKAWEQ